jgi:lambda family phage portal protein
MFNTIAKWFRPKPTSAVNKPRLQRQTRGSIPESQRDWKAVNGDEPSMSHWRKATGMPINSILLNSLDQLIDRSLYESRANPIVDGTINSHGTDVVGPNGPTLQVLSTDSNWAKKAESIWREVSESIDGSGELSLAELLKQDVRSLWTTGGILSQYVYDEDAPTVVKQRLNPLSCQSLYSGRFNMDDTLLGIKRNKLGRPVSYYILEYGINVTAFNFKINPIEIPARDIQHVYYKYEPRQWRGYPWLSSCLQALAELDEYDTAVLDAAKVAAMMAVLFYNIQDSVEAQDDPPGFELKRMSAIKVPPGWQPLELNGNQPTATHGEFKRDKIRDLGRTVGMPLMSIQRDASNHNYSSARFDGQGYSRANESIQSFLAHKRINPFVLLVLTEAMLKRQLPYRNPMDVAKELSWIWPQPPHVDPVKEAMAQRINMENKTLSPQRACLANNVDFETICDEWKKANEILKKNGLPEFMGPIPTDPTVLAALLKGDGNDNNSKPTK